MEIQNLNSEIKVFYIKAQTFPTGIKAAHEKLHSLVPVNDGRRFYGISFGSPTGEITYYAAAEELTAGEAEKYSCEKFTIRKGPYLAVTLKDWCKEEGLVERTFRNLLSDPRLDDENGYCLEEYLSETDMICMVTLDPEKIK